MPDSGRETKLLDAYFEALGVYEVAVQTMAKLAGSQSAAFNQARDIVEQARRKTHDARAALHAFRSREKSSATHY